MKLVVCGVDIRFLDVGKERTLRVFQNDVQLRKFGQTKIRVTGNGEDKHNQDPRSLLLA
jgi:hypothetical protein